MDKLLNMGIDKIKELRAEVKRLTEHGDLDRSAIIQYQMQVESLTTEGAAVRKYIKYARESYEQGDWDDVKEALDDALSASGKQA